MGVRKLFLSSYSSFFRKFKAKPTFKCTCQSKKNTMRCRARRLTVQRKYRAAQTSDVWDSLLKASRAWMRAEQTRDNAKSLRAPSAGSAHLFFPCIKVNPMGMASIMRSFCVVRMDSADNQEELKKSKSASPDLHRLVGYYAQES